MGIYIQINDLLLHNVWSLLIELLLVNSLLKISLILILQTSLKKIFVKKKMIKEMKERNKLHQMRSVKKMRKRLLKEVWFYLISN
jgi:hypothetical protein